MLINIGDGLVEALKETVDKRLGKETSEEEFKEWLENECEEWLFDDERFDVVESVEHFFELDVEYSFELE